MPGEFLLPLVQGGAGLLAGLLSGRAVLAAQLFVGLAGRLGQFALPAGQSVGVVGVFTRRFPGLGLGLRRGFVVQGFFEFLQLILRGLLRAGDFVRLGPGQVGCGLFERAGRLPLPLFLAGRVGRLQFLGQGRFLPGGVGQFLAKLVRLVGGLLDGLLGLPAQRLLVGLELVEFLPRLAQSLLVGRQAGGQFVERGFCVPHAPVGIVGGALPQGVGCLLRVRGGALPGDVRAGVARGCLEFGGRLLDCLLLAGERIPLLFRQVRQRLVLGFLPQSLPQGFLELCQLAGGLARVARLGGGVLQVGGQAVEFLGGLLLLLGGLVEITLVEGGLGRVIGLERGGLGGPAGVVGLVAELARLAGQFFLLFAKLLQPTGGSPPVGGLHRLVQVANLFGEFLGLGRQLIGLAGSGGLDRFFDRLGLVLQLPQARLNLLLALLQLLGLLRVGGFRFVRQFLLLVGQFLQFSFVEPFLRQPFVFRQQFLDLSQGVLQRLVGGGELLVALGGVRRVAGRGEGLGGRANVPLLQPADRLGELAQLGRDGGFVGEFAGFLGGFIQLFPGLAEPIHLVRGGRALVAQRTPERIGRPAVGLQLVANLAKPAFDLGLAAIDVLLRQRGGVVANAELSPVFRRVPGGLRLQV